MRRIWLLLAILGAAWPFSQFLPWLMEYGLNVDLMLRLLFANPISSFFAIDLLVTGIVVLVLMAIEGRERNVRHRWVAMLGTICVGPSFGLPLYLYLREAND